jgi:hypothetical protein
MAGRIQVEDMEYEGFHLIRGVWCITTSILILLIFLEKEVDNVDYVIS